MSWASETRKETKLRWQAYHLEQRGFVELPYIEELPKSMRVAELQRAIYEGEAERASKLKELESSIQNNKAHIGKDADLKVQRALTGADNEKFDKMKKLLDDIKKAKELHESTSELYSELWDEVDSYDALQVIETEIETGVSSYNTPF